MFFFSVSDSLLSHILPINVVYFRWAGIFYEPGAYGECVRDVDNFLSISLAFMAVSKKDWTSQSLIIAESLFIRGKAKALMGDCHGSHIDLRGACAAVRLQLASTDESTRPKVVLNLFKKTSTLLHVLARAKLEDAALRPLFDPNTAHCIEKELGVGPFSHFMSHCKGCSTQESEEMKLKVCGGCKRAQYCSRECLKKDWGCHRNYCSDFECTHGGSNAFALKCIAEGSGAALALNEDCPFVCLCSTTTDLLLHLT